MAINLTGTNYIDGLLFGHSWTGNTGQNATITYSYTLDTWAYDTAGTVHFNDRTLQFTTISTPFEFNNLQKTATESVFESFSNITNLTFQNVGTSLGNDTDMVLRQGFTTPGLFGWTKSAYNNNGIIEDITTPAQEDPLQDKVEHTDLLFNGDRNSSTTISSPKHGTEAFETIMHEIGHALGLAHPHDGGGVGNTTLTGMDGSFNGTIMSYNNGINNTGISDGMPITPMIYDIATLQYLYGKNTVHNGSDTTYILDGKKSLDGIDHTNNLESGYIFVSETIWDSGGNDTIDTSAYIGSSIIDLREGLDNVTIVGKTKVWNAFNASIENATGGSGDDEIYGNGLNNTLTGNGGNDTYKFSGTYGKDTIIDDDGIIEIDGTILSGTATLTTTANKYLLKQDGKYFVMSKVNDSGVMDEAGKHLRIAVNDSSDTPENNVTIKDFTPISTAPLVNTAFDIQLSEGIEAGTELLIATETHVTGQFGNSIQINVDDPSITALSDGSFVALWDINPGYDPYDDVADNIVGQRFNVDGSKNGNEFIVATETHVTGQFGNSIQINVDDPSITALSDGSFVALWDINPGYDPYDDIADNIVGKVFGSSTQTLPTFGTPEADNLVGNNDNNTFVGGAGNDNINGGTGNDAYAFSAGDDFDTITDKGGSDTLKLGGGLTPDNLTFSQVGKNLVIDIASGVTIVDQFSGNPNNVIEFASFDDGTIIELPSATNKVTGTTGRDILTGTPANDVISSLGGSIDRMSGGEGADIFVIGSEANNGVRERDIILDYEVGIDSILLEDGASVGSIRQTSSGAAIFLEGDRDAIYVQGENILVGNLTIIPENISMAG